MYLDGLEQTSRGSGDWMDRGSPRRPLPRAVSRRASGRSEGQSLRGAWAQSPRCDSCSGVRLHRKTPHCM